MYRFLDTTTRLRTELCVFCTNFVFLPELPTTLTRPPNAQYLNAWTSTVMAVHV